jgi:hypothetical protein
VDGRSWIQKGEHAKQDNRDDRENEQFSRAIQQKELM